MQQSTPNIRWVHLIRGPVRQMAVYEQPKKLVDMIPCTLAALMLPQAANKIFSSFIVLKSFNVRCCILHSVHSLNRSTAVCMELHVLEFRL